MSAHCEPHSPQQPNLWEPVRPFTYWIKTFFLLLRTAIFGPLLVRFISALKYSSLKAFPGRLLPTSGPFLQDYIPRLPPSRQHSPDRSFRRPSGFSALNKGLKFPWYVFHAFEHILDIIQEMLLTINLCFASSYLIYIIFLKYIIWKSKFSSAVGFPEVSNDVVRRDNVGVCRGRAKGRQQRNRWSEFNHLPHSVARTQPSQHRTAFSQQSPSSQTALRRGRLLLGLYVPCNF